MDFTAMRLKIASPEDIRSWSFGEVLKPETINYRTQRPEKDGLFSERIFGPTKDYECYCGKYKKIRYKGIVCDKCGVEVTRAAVRRERMGHIELATPVAHIWFLRSVPSRLALVLNTSLLKLEKVVYYAAYIIVTLDEAARKDALAEIDRELKSRREIEAESADDLEAAAQATRELIKNLRVGQILSESEFVNLSRRFSSVFTALAGAEGIHRVLQGIDSARELRAVERELEKTDDLNRRQQLSRRLKIFTAMEKNKIRPEWMILTALPILPPDLRPMVALDGGRYATSDLNDLYRRVINRNNRLKKLVELKAPEIIVTNEKRMLQEAVDALIDNTARMGRAQLSARRRPLRSLADMLKGKQGRFRANLLGKRVDYSGRSVIVVGPRLKYDECGLPKKMALELFKPFVIGKILDRGLAHNVKNANRLIEAGPAEVWEILEEVIENRHVLLNRAPTLHRLGIQAFKPILIEDLTIQIPPLVCSGFNADFDGDQMAVHLPLTDEAQTESREIMLSSRNLLKSASGGPVPGPWNDITLGCYYVTGVDPEGVGSGRIFSDSEEALLAYEFGYVGLRSLVRVGMELETTCGRLIFNEALPADFGYLNKEIDKKALNTILGAAIERYGLDLAKEILDAIQQIGFTYGTKSGITWGMGDLSTPPEKKGVIAEGHRRVDAINAQYHEGLLTDSERYSRVIEIWEKVKQEVEQIVTKAVPALSSVRPIISSGARGSWEQINQMMGMRGLVKNPQGQIIDLPVTSSYKEGLTPLQYFISVHGNRKGLVDTALKTAEAGHLTRRMIEVAHDVIVREEDCRTKEGIAIRRADGKEFNHAWSDRLFSRTVLEDLVSEGKTLVRAGEIITAPAARAIEESALEVVQVRSPITCKTLYGMCSKCYGLDLGRNAPVAVGEAVGIIAAQSIGEPGTQLTLRTTHSGGVARVDITSGLPRIDELFEVRVPKGKALIAEYDGVVQDIVDEGAHRTLRLQVFKKKSVKPVTVDHQVPRVALLLVQVGQSISRGDALTEGSLDLHELFTLRGKEAVYRYIIGEVQKIYISQGAGMSDKHIEVIVRQLFGRVRITASGESPFVLGEVINKSDFFRINRALKRARKEVARAEEILFGMTRASLNVGGFLAAASFQETARVLVGAAIEGKVDELRGLKENVIIGRLLPIGTSYRREFMRDAEPASDSVSAVVPVGAITPSVVASETPSAKKEDAPQ